MVPMADPTGGDRPAPGNPRAALTTAEVRAFIDRAPRCRVQIAVLCVQPGLPNFVETQLVDLSRTGMFLASGHLLNIGTSVDFQFSLGGNMVALRGSAEVVRHVDEGERGMGLRFTALDEAGRKLIDRIVQVTSEPPDTTPMEAHGDPAVQYEHGSLRIALSTTTAVYFTYNPLLHIGVGGCFVPAETDVPLGTGYQVDILEPTGRLMLRCKAKVAAKQEHWIGIRLLDVERIAMLELRAEVARLAEA
jgi:hypothetical protein